MIYKKLFFDGKSIRFEKDRVKKKKRRKTGEDKGFREIQTD
jgi:hypothetical protein